MDPNSMPLLAELGWWWETGAYKHVAPLELAGWTKKTEGTRTEIFRFGLSAFLDTTWSEPPGPNSVRLTL